MGGGCSEKICKACGYLSIEEESVKTIGSFQISVRDAKDKNRYLSKHFSRPLIDDEIIKGYDEKETSMKINIREKKRMCDCDAGYENGIVLDPFMGSGTTALVSLKQNKKFIGIEICQKYIDIAYKRIMPYLEQTKIERFG